MVRLPRLAPFGIVIALALPPRARADVTIIYAPAGEPAPLVARPVRGAPAALPPEPARPEPARPEPARPEPARPEPAPVIPVAAPVERSVRPQPLPPPRRPTPAARPSEPSPCRPPVVLVRVAEGSRERRSLALLDCEGRPDAESLTALSVLARPAGAPLPDAAALAAHARDATWIAPSIRRLHPGLLERLRVIADAFPGHAIEIVAGHRPEAPARSRHLHGLALDLRVVGASLDAVLALASRFERTGVGLYPAAGLVHIDVRARATRWVDESGPGEPPRPTASAAPARGRRIRAAAAPASPPARPLPIAHDDEIDVHDVDAIAEQVTRALGERWRLPPPPPR